MKTVFVISKKKQAQIDRKAKAVVKAREDDKMWKDHDKAATHNA